MGSWLLPARLVLASVLTAAAVGKLWDRAGARKSLADFGVPAWAAKPLSALLPWIELCIAAALGSAGALPIWAAAAAFVLLSVFTTVIGMALAGGRRPECRCFGQLQARPISGFTLARNAVLLLMAGAIVTFGDRDAPGVATLLIGTSKVAEPRTLMAVGALSVLTWFVIQLFRQQARLLVRIDAMEKLLEVARPAIQPSAGLPIGTPAPPFALTTLAGTAISLQSLSATRKPVVLVFTDPECEPCAALLPELARRQRDGGDEPEIAVISGGAAEAVRRRVQGHGLSHVLLQENSQVVDAYGAYWTPSAVLIRPDGTVGSRLVVGPEEVVELLDLGRSTGVESAAG